MSHPAYAVTIANGAALSGAVEVSQRVGDARTALVGIVTDPTGWTAAVLTFDVSADGTTYYPLYNAAGTEVSIPSAMLSTTSAWIALDPADFAGVAFVKLRSGTKAATVNQGAARALSLVVRAV